MNSKNDDEKSDSKKESADASNDDEVIEIAEDPVDAKASGASEVDELKKQNLYLMADFDNYRKQAIKERSELIKFGNEPIIREFLGVLDNLERASTTPVTAETLETYKNGVEMIVSQFKKALERFGVEEVDPKGQTFDPMMHEALGSDNNPNLPPNSVTQVLKKAYKLRGKVIRPAQVLVNSSTT